MKIYLTPILCLCAITAFAQSFSKVTNTSNPIVTDIPTMGYAGASWVDYDHDGDLDLFVNQDFLYQNTGDGDFIRILNSGIEGVSIEYNNGNSWADYDNDGFIDLMLVNRNQNGLHHNNGDGTFTKVTNGDIATNVNAWSPAWADYDNDGWLDLVATHSCGGTGNPCHSNWLFHNNGDGTFTEITDSEVTTELAAFTSANWSDFDDDGDMDLFIGSGQIGFTSKDHIYINQLSETGAANLVRLQTGVLFGDERDGQNWNLIDYDNDGDLDGFVTNWKEDVPCDFYQNNGDGTFNKLTQADLGVHMVSEEGKWLANVWGDFDNDGWLDVIIGADGSGVNHCYRNKGDGTFEHVFTPFTNDFGSRGITVGDYDNDGDLDLFINAYDISLKGLYTNNQTGNNWVNFTLEGTISNRSAIGAKVRIYTTINGVAMWQMREVSSQNSFAGHNSQRVHFGLGDAQMIDTLIIEWPSGLVEMDVNLGSNQFYSFIEGAMTSVLEAPSPIGRVVAFPNPFSETITIELRNSSDKTGQVTIINNKGALVYDVSHIISDSTIDLELGFLPSGVYRVVVSLGKKQLISTVIKTN